MIRLENVLKSSLQDVLRTSCRRLEDVFKMFLQDVLKMYDQDDYVGLDQDVFKTSSEDVWVRRIFLSWSKHLGDVLKTSSKDEDERRLEDVFRTSSSRRMFAGLMAKRFFNSPSVLLNFPWIELQMLLNCCLLHKTLSYRVTLYFVHLSLCLPLGLFMSWICDLFFHYHCHFPYN